MAGDFADLKPRAPHPSDSYSAKHNRNDYTDNNLSKKVIRRYTSPKRFDASIDGYKNAITAKKPEQPPQLHEKNLRLTHIEPRCLAERCFGFGKKNRRPPSPEVIVPVPVQRVSPTTSSPTSFQSVGRTKDSSSNSKHNSTADIELAMESNK